jgi:serine protease Do
MRLARQSALALATGLILGLSLGVLGTTVADTTVAASAADATLSQTPITGGTFARLAEAVKPAVINVTVQRRAPNRPADIRGLGSGVIIDRSGIALTNAHVVEGVRETDVVLLDGTKHRARVLGVDAKTDLAVLKLSGDGPFPALPLGDSDAVRVGDWVLAVGSPFGLSATITQGIVSAKARQIGAGPYDDFLQTDAAINPGNSGGPLINMRGEIIGINTAILRGGTGIGFAIPSNLAKRIAGDLATTGAVNRGWLGVSLSPLTADVAASSGVKDATGVVVAEVQPDSPAARAGLRTGDVVIEWNGRKVADANGLARAIGTAKPGDQARVTVWRDRESKRLTITLAAPPRAA